MSSVMTQPKGRKKSVRKDKLEKVEQLYSYLKDASLFVIVAYQSKKPSLSVNQITKLRKALGEFEGKMLVSKNTLMKIALEKLGITELSEYLKGPNAVILAYEKPIEVLKALFKFVKETEKETGVKLPEVKVGFFEGTLYDAAKLEDLSKLPSKEELLGMLVGTMKAPITGIATSLSSIIRNFAIVINQVKEQKEKEAA